MRLCAPGTGPGRRVRELPKHFREEAARHTSRAPRKCAEQPRTCGGNWEVSRGKDHSPGAVRGIHGEGAGEAGDGHLPAERTCWGLTGLRKRLSQEGNNSLLLPLTP